jgi:hypothetical protein
LVPTFAFLISLERVCTKDYSYDNGRIKIKKGQVITIPTYVLHHSEEYYPDPEKFDPERYRKHLKDYLDLLANLLVYIFFSGGLLKTKLNVILTLTWHSALVHAIVLECALLWKN